MIKRLLSLAALVLLVGCSAGQVSAPSTDEAQAAMQVDVNHDAAQGRTTAVNVNVVSVGTCTPNASHPITTCSVKWAASGQALNSKVAFWTTPNPRHPWRAHIISQPATPVTP